ncbi:MAG: TauD/TfdA family dioxygenase [Cellvibrionaceae bacterium]
MTYISNMASELKFDAQQFPTVIANSDSIATLADAQQWVQDNLTELKKELAQTGAILFRGFPITDAQSYDAFFSSFGYANFTYKESLSNAVRINHTEYVFTANEAPKDVEIYLHNEMAQTPIFPNIISLFCEAAAEKGGETAISRSDLIYQELHQAHPEQTDQLEKLGIKYTTQMPAEDSPESGQGRSWRGTLNVETRQQAEAKLKKLGYSWTWNPDNSLSAQTGALPAIKSLEDGRKIFFNQVVAAYMGWKGARENPGSVLRLGDDSEFSREFLESIAEIAQRLAYNLAWQDGDVAIVDNHLAMHGRLPYSGERKRKVLVVLGR